MKADMVKKGNRKDSDVEEAFKRTYMAKKALYKLQGLGDVSPGTVRFNIRKSMANACIFRWSQPTMAYGVRI